MMISDPAATREALQKRVRRLLRLDRGADDDSELTRQIFPFLKSLGSVVLIGGAIRDVARAGKRAFSSDLDFVVYDTDSHDFVKRMATYNGVANRFGGYALNRFSFKVDLWHIEDTWAKTAGHVAVQEPVDLLNCTFFDWDSALFDLNSSRLIIPPDYFQKLSSNIMDIRLEENPNRMGSMVRALRRASLWHVKFGPRLTEFSRRCLSEMRWEDLIALDDRAFVSPVLKYLERDRVLARLMSPCRSLIGEVTHPVPERHQMKLPLIEEPISLSTIANSTCNGDPASA